MSLDPVARSQVKTLIRQNGPKIFAQEAEPDTDAKALWFPTDSNDRPTGEVLLQIPPVPPPTAPSALSGNAATATTVNLSWTDNSTDEVTFQIQRDTDNTFPSPASLSAAANATTYGDSGLTGSTTYYYRIRAVRGLSHSAWSSTASVTTPAAPFSMLDLTPAGWWKADALVLSDGAAVSSWADSSGNGRSLTDDANAAQRPTFHTNVQNSLGGVQFDGVDDWLKTAAAWSAMSQPVTVAMVINHTGGEGIFDGGGGRFALGFGLGVPGHMEIYAGSGAMGAAQSSPSGLHLWTFVVNGASSLIRKDRAVFANSATNVGSNTLASGVYVGKFTGAGAKFAGHVHELAVLPGQPDPTGFESYLRTKWGTP